MRGRDGRKGGMTSNRGEKKNRGEERKGRMRIDSDERSKGEINECWEVSVL